MGVYTRTGDKGETSLASGKRVSKSHPRLEAYGTVDELNAVIGLLGCNFPDDDEQRRLLRIQNRIFVVSSNLAVDLKEVVEGLPKLLVEDISELEAAIDKMQDQLPPLKNFVLPGCHQIVAYCHLARTICRRAERSMVKLSESEEVEDLLIIYINRLSDYLFVMARYATFKLGIDEIKWFSDFRDRED